MQTFYYRTAAGEIKHITLNPIEYGEMIKTTTLFDTREEARRAKR